MPSDLHQRASLPSELLSLDLLRPFVLEKDEWFRTDSGTSYRLSKSRTSLSCRKVRPQPKENTTRPPISQQEINDFHRNSQTHRGDHAKAFVGNKLRNDRGVIFGNQCWTYSCFEISLAGFAEQKLEIDSPRECAPGCFRELEEDAGQLQNRTGKTACATRRDAGHHDHDQDDS